MDYRQKYSSYKKRYLEEKTLLMGGETKSENRSDDIYNAVKNGDRVLTRSLLSKNKDAVNETYKYGNTLLHIAVKKGYPKMVKLLIKNGADVNAKNSKKSTPLHLLAAATKISNSKTDKIFKILLKKGAKIDKQDKSGNTPLHLAVLEHNVNMVKQLFDEGAKKKIRNKAGHTAVGIAERGINISSGTEYKQLLKILNILKPKSSNKITIIDNSSPINLSGISRCNLNFGEFLANYFRSAYNQLYALMSYENNSINIVVKSRPGLPPPNMTNYVQSWAEFTAEYNPIYYDKFYHNRNPMRDNYWSEPTVDMYLLYLLVSLRSFITNLNIKLCTEQVMTYVPQNRVFIEPNYSININDGSDNANSRIRHTIAELTTLVSNARAGSKLVGGIYNQVLFVYLS